MVPERECETTPDPIETVDAALSDAWKRICATVDIVADVPSLAELLENADVNRPERAAEAIVVNMLSEAMEWVCRFSPWYTKPASAYGLTRVHDEETGAVTWRLSDEGLCQWKDVVAPLAAALEGKGGLINFYLLVDDFMGETNAKEECVTAACGCVPPRYVLVGRAVVDTVEVVCDVCRQRFQAVGKGG